jgi:predicted RNase H-like nuclease (RuvC/YqgF family)
MMPSTDTEIRDAVVKLEAKMEVMSESMASMADSVAKLADLRVELVSMKKDTTHLEQRVSRQEKDVDELFTKTRELEKVQDKNTYVIGKIELFWTAVITGAASFLWWMLK